MGLKEDIEALKKEKKLTKSTLLNEYREDILEMINLKIPLVTQIELLTKNKIIEKIDIKEYRNILIKDFGYIAKAREVKSAKNDKPKVKIVEPKSEAVNPKPQPPRVPPKSPKDILSEEITLV